MLQLWMLDICMGWHGGFLPLTLAGMLQEPWGDNIQGSRRGIRQSFPWVLQWQEPGHSQKLMVVTMAGTELLALTIFSEDTQGCGKGNPGVKLEDTWK